MKLQQEVDGLRIDATNLAEEVERAGDEVRGQGVQAGFKVFC